MNITIQRLGHAIKDGDVNIVLNYIKQGGDLESKTPNNSWTPLFLAGLYRKDFIGLLLLNNGANPLAAHTHDRKEKIYPIHFASDDRTPILLSQLLRDMKLTEKVKYDLLESTLDNGILESAKILLLTGLEMNDKLWEVANEEGNKCSYNFNTELFVAELKNLLDKLKSEEVRKRERAYYKFDIKEVVSEVLECLSPGLNSKNYIASRLIEEVRNDFRELAKEEALAPVELIHKLAGRGDSCALKKCLEQPKFDESTLARALSYGMQEKHEDVVKVLLDYGANPNI